MKNLEQALQRLGTASRSAIDARRSAVAVLNTVGAEPPRLTEAELSHLARMLHQQDFAAIEQFQRLAPALSARWGPQRFAQIHEAVEELDFATALSLIEHATEAIATGQSAG